MHARSEAIAPYTYIGVSYMTCDMLAMYHTYCQSRNLASVSGHNFLLFARSKPLLVAHHMVLVLGYPLLVVRAELTRCLLTVSLLFLLI
jgi:hypothetical protein